MPATQVASTPALPDAAPALPDASPAPAEAASKPADTASAENVTPAAEPAVTDIIAGQDAPAAAPATTPAATPAAQDPAQPSADAILGAPAAGPATAALEDKPETATYRLQIKPWGTVFVDGKEKGVSPPLKRLVLPAGKHKIRVVNPNFPDYFVDVNLAKNKSGTIEHDFAARAK
jgi:hypothetical protein